MNLIGIIACSDGRKKESETLIHRIQTAIVEIGYETIFAKTIYQIDNTPFSGTPKDRAEELMKLFINPNVKAIVDISGGDTANQILPYLDYELIKENKKPFFGISDLSVILNAIYSCSKIPAYHFQVSTIVENSKQIEWFKKILHDEQDITFSYTFLSGNSLSGIVIGGNIRCFLKLAGTKYMPDPTGKILFLESLGGGSNRMASLLAQIEQLGIFEKCSGVLLGTFSIMENEKLQPTIEALVLEITEKYHLPIVKTNWLGHGPNAHCIAIGEKLVLKTN